MFNISGVLFFHNSTGILLPGLIREAHLSRVGKTCGLKIIANTRTIMRAQASNQGQIKIDDVEMDEFDKLRYLVSYISKDLTIEKEVNIIIGSASATFKRLDNVCMVAPSSRMCTQSG